MSERTRIALLGFTDFERESFEAFFRHADGAAPTHELVAELWRADCAVADADDEEAVARAQHAGLMERTVLLGSRPCEDAALQLPRPVNLVLVLRALDTLVGVRERGGATRLASPVDSGVLPPVVPPRPSTPPQDHVQRVLEELAYRTTTLPSSVDVRALAAAGAPAAAAARGAASAVPRQQARTSVPVARAPLPLEHVLLVSTEPGDYRQVVLTLQGFGFQTHLAQGQPQALGALARRLYRYVFIDPQAPGTDALLLCRLARDSTAQGDEPGAAVVLLVDPQAASEALQRALPAADAALRRPLRRRDLLRLVGERELERYAFADTVQTITRF